MGKIPAIGIDVGGTGIKGAAVDLDTGELVTSRHKELTPTGGEPHAIGEVVAQMVASIRDELAENGLCPIDQVPAIGVTLPGVVHHGVLLTAANISRVWIGTNAETLFAELIGAPCTVVNDADAAGIAEAVLGAALGKPGVTMLVTFGTGIGTALIHDGVLVPNFELGHLELDGHRPYEKFASPKNIEQEGITIDEWANRAGRYLAHLEFVCRPDRFVIGGSISTASAEYLPFDGVTIDVVPAQFRNNAGIIGAARLAATQ